MLLDILFPKFCIQCGKLGAYICAKCATQVTRHKQVCCVCRKFSPLGKTHAYCEQYTSLTSLIIATEYSNTIKKTIIRIKYNRSYDLVNELLSITINTPKIVEELRSQNFDLCTEVPMYISKEYQRGFNQTKCIAEWIQKMYKIQHKTVLKKIKTTHAQMQLNRADRLFNISNSMEIINTELVNQKTILLVDDVITTGATLEEAASLLVKNNAKKVVGLVIASGT